MSYNMNLRFIKPSKTFYNKLMSIWFRFSYMVEEELKHGANFNPINIKKAFFNFSVNTIKKNGDWNVNYVKPIEKFAEIVSSEYYS